MLICSELLSIFISHIGLSFFFFYCLLTVLCIVGIFIYVIILPVYCDIVDIQHWCMFKVYSIMI